MNEAQFITLGLSIVLPVSALIYSNSRISDAKETLRAELGALRSDLKAEMVVNRSELKSQIDSLRVTLERIDDNVARLLADHERRLTKLEAQRS